MCSNDKNPFALKAACKDCPFKKGKSYLHPERIAGIIRDMSHDDSLFPCHKTTQNDARFEYNEAMENIENELEFFDSESGPELEAYKQELYKKYNIEQLEQNLLDARLNTEKICAGWLILGKKENLINSNFRLRMAQMQNLLSLDQFKNEDQIFDSAEDAINSHAKI